MDPRRTALVVVDLVPFFVTQNPYCRAIVPHVNRLAVTLRATGGMVAWVLPGPGGNAAVQEEFVMVADANAAVRDEDHNATLHTIYRSFGDVRPTDDVIELLGPTGGE